MASENGPCRIDSGVVSMKLRAGAQSRAEVLEHFVEACDLALHVRQRIGRVGTADDERARVAEDARHVTQQILRRSNAFAGVEIGERIGRIAERLLRAIGEGRQKMAKEIARGRVHRSIECSHRQECRATSKLRLTTTREKRAVCDTSSPRRKEAQRHGRHRSRWQWWR